MRLRINIGKDRRNSLPLQGMGGGNEGKGGHDHLALHSQGADGDLKRHGGVANGDAVFDSQKLAEFLLELFDQWAAVGQPVVIEHLVGVIHKLLAVPNVGTANMQGFSKSRLTAQDGQCLFFAQEVSPST